jgi:hypothetical protein
MKNSQLTLGVELEDCAAAGAAFGRCPVEVPVCTLDERHELGVLTVSPVEAYNGLEGLCRRDNRRRDKEQKN